MGYLSWFISRKRLLLNTGIAVILTVLLLPAMTPVNADGLVAEDPLANLSFETGNTSGWKEVKPIADSISVIPIIDEFTIDNKGTSVNVTPLLGNYMLRLGTPKNIREKQESGNNTVRQTFIAETTSITVAFRLFSWEFRGDDTFLVDIQGQTESANLSVVFDEIDASKTHSISEIADASLPINVRLDSGKSGDLLNTGWVRAKISGLIPGDSYTLIYSVIGGENNSHATWAYFDDGNLPPVADFNNYPTSPWEGDFIELVDNSTDPDGDGIVAWDWTVTITDSNRESTTVQSDLKNPVLILGNECNLNISLKVRDSNGAWSSDAVQNVDVGNAPPSVNALNVQIVTEDGEEIPETENVALFGRFIDPGWIDNHFATWATSDGDNPSPPAILTEEHIPYMGTGYVSGVMSVNTTDLLNNGGIDGKLTVSDAIDSTTVDFTINTPRVVAPNNITGNATLVASNSTIISYIHEIGDVDIYTLDPNLPVGTEILVNLKNLPADYDLIILNDSPDSLNEGGFQMGGFQMGGYQMGGYQMGAYQMGGYQMGGFQMGGFQMGAFQMGGDLQTAAYQMGGYQMGAYQMGGFQMGGFQMGGYQMGGYQMGAYQMGAYQMGDPQSGAYQMGGYQMGHYPLSQIGSMEAEGQANDNVGSADIAFNELGISLSELGASENTTVVGFSANSGIADETLLATIDQPGTTLYIVVVGANDSYNSAEPYSLQIEKSEPLDIQLLLSRWGVPPYPKPVDVYDDSYPNMYYLSETSPDTLFVTQIERLEGRYKESTNWTGLEAKIVELNASTNVSADILSVPISIPEYQIWDDDYSDINAVNTLASKIRGEIQNYLDQHPNVKYVVILGNDDIIPYFRSPDETSIGNERQYALSSYIKPGSPIFYSLLNGYVLTDDFYVDANPIPWQGRSLFLPDISISRLVETPNEMIEAIQQFIDNKGILPSDTALVTGYDGFADGASAAKTTLEGHSDVDSLLTDTWTSDELAQEFLGSPAHNIDNLNAHYTHFTALAAYGSSVGDYSDILTSIQVQNANILNSIFFTMGCHAGLNVPYEAALNGDALGLNVDPQLDFPQAMNKSIVLGSTGFGYFDDEGIGGTERLMGIFVDKLLNNGPTTVGDALVNAKWYYLGSSSAWTVYDEKSTMQFELYGLPHYKVEGSHSGDNPSSGNYLLTLSDDDLVTEITFNDGIPSQTWYLKKSNNLNGGGYYYYATEDIDSLTGDYQSTAFRPIQPRVVIDSSDIDNGPPIHGLVLTGGTYEDIQAFDPVITRPANVWELEILESQLLPTTFWPSELVKINNLVAGSSGQPEQTVIITPGQFRPKPVDSDPVRGVERLFTSLTFDVLRSTSDDFTPPSIESIDILDNKDGTTSITVEASDENGIASIIVLGYTTVDNDGTVSVLQSLNDISPSETDEYSVIIDSPGENVTLVIQIIDENDNVTFATSKGNHLKKIDISAEPIDIPPIGKEFTVNAYIDYPDDLTPPFFYTWDMGDDQFEQGVTYTDNISVNHTYTTYPTTNILKVKVTDSAGGIGNAVVRMFWVDNDPDGYGGNDPNLDLTRATMGNDDTEVTIIMEVVGNIADENQYRVEITNASGQTTKLKYTKGSITGVDGFAEREGNNRLEITFALSELGNVVSGDILEVFFEVQSGVPGGQQQGFPDRMPDEAYFTYQVR